MLEDKNEILFSSPYTFNSTPIITKDWTPNFNFHEAIMRVVPPWIRFPNLPLNCLGPKTLSRIGSMIGVPLYADERTTRQMRVSFARLIIEVDVTKPLPRSMAIEGDNGEIVEQNIMNGSLLFARNAQLLGMIVPSLNNQLG